MMLSSKSIALIGASLPLLLKGAAVTVLVALCAAVIGFVFGVLAGIFSCNRLKYGIVPFFINAYVLLIRGTPISLQVLIIYYVLPGLIGIDISPLVAGIVALGCNSTAYVAETMRGGLNALPVGQWEACYVLGYSPVAMLWAVILPQVIKKVAASLTNELVTLIKETSILSIIGLLEITKIGMNISAKTLDPLTIYATIAVIYLCMTTTISLVAKKLENRGHHD